MKTNKKLTSFGGRLKRIRTSKKLSQTELARICEMQKASLSKIEQGKVNISYTTIYRLAAGLDVPITNIVD